MRFLRRGKDLFTVGPDGLIEAPQSEQGANEQADAASNPTPAQKLAAILLGLTLGTGVGTLAPRLIGRNEVHYGPALNADATAWQDKMAKADAARRAIAARYTSCSITSVVDKHESKIREGSVPDELGLPTPMQRVPRNEVVITLNATKRAASMAAERAYADGTPDAKIVQWHPFELGAATHIIKQNQQGEYYPVYIPSDRETQVNGATETITVTMYPRTDARLRTTDANVTLNTHTETYDGRQGDGVTYKDVGRVSCGSVYEAPLDGQPTWQVAPGDTPGVKDFEYFHGVCNGAFTQKCTER